MTNSTIVTIILFIAAVVAFIPLCVIGFVYTTFKHVMRWDYSLKKQFWPIFQNLSLILDGLANSFAGELLNDILIKLVDQKWHPEAYKYGKWYDTISEVTGVNEERGTLNALGVLFTRLLGRILNDNHSILAINRNRTYPAHTKTK